MDHKTRHTRAFSQGLASLMMMLLGLVRHLLGRLGQLHCIQGKSASIG